MSACRPFRLSWKIEFDSPEAATHDDEIASTLADQLREATAAHTLSAIEQCLDDIDASRMHPLRMVEIVVDALRSSIGVDCLRAQQDGTCPQCQAQLHACEAWVRSRVRAFRIQPPGDVERVRVAPVVL